MKGVMHGYSVDLEGQPKEPLEPCSACARDGWSEDGVLPGATCGTLCASHAMAFEEWLARYPNVEDSGLFAWSTV